MEILDSIESTIRKSGWTTGAFVDEKGRYCLVGGVYRVVIDATRKYMDSGAPFNEAILFEESYRNEILARLYTALPEEFRAPIPEGIGDDLGLHLAECIAQFNDSCASMEEALALVERAKSVGVNLWACYNEA